MKTLKPSFRLALAALALGASTLQAQRAATACAEVDTNGGVTASTASDGGGGYTPAATAASPRTMLESPIPAWKRKTPITSSTGPAGWGRSRLRRVTAGAPRTTLSVSGSCWRANRETSIS